MPQSDTQAKRDTNELKKNHAIDNFIEHVNIPIDIIGNPLINGLFSQENFVISLTITDGSLAVSYYRGAHVIFHDDGVIVPHGELINIDPMWKSNSVFQIYKFKPGDASGQNMVTVATRQICVATVLTGEFSINAALANDDFAKTQEHSIKKHEYANHYTSG